jgi:hypothetical protein
MQPLQRMEKIVKFLETRSQRKNIKSGKVNLIVPDN